MRLFTLDQARSALSLFDQWVSRSATSAEITSADIALAGSFLRRLDLPLRAKRLGATVVTFDLRMADSVRTLGVAISVPKDCRSVE